MAAKSGGRAADGNATVDSAPPSHQANDRAPWLTFADAVLQREALIARLGRGAPPSEFAGLFIGEEELDRLMLELPGMDGASPQHAGEIRDRFASRVAERAAQLHRSLKEPDDQFTIICWNAGLSGPEAEVLAVLAAVEADPARQRIMGYIQDNVTYPRPTLAAVQRLFPAPHPGAQAVAGDSRLLRACLITIAEEGPWASRMISVESSVMWSLVDDTSLDPALPAGVNVFRSDGDAAGPGLLLVTGGNRAGRLELAAEHGAGQLFLHAPMPAESQQWDALVREATVKGLTVILDYDGDGLLPVYAKHRIDRAGQVHWVISSPSEIAVESLPERNWREVRADDREATSEEWMTRLGIEPPAGHRLDQEQLRLVAAAYPAAGDDIEAAVRRLAGGHLDRLARRIRPRRSWDDLVLPADQRAQLEELVTRFRHRDIVYDDWEFQAFPSAGLVALFAGASGTGKTLSAEIIAAELGLDLYKIDLSSVVSKYIGETEKNLERIFNAAAAANLVLFFDEADAIFGKRSEVSDARDRYANIEVSYLLQRMESYDGLVVLATNFKKNIDEAFLRRIHIAIEFSMPAVAERQAIWEISFPNAAPTDKLDFEWLAAQFEIAGGTIRNAALNAAFSAASADKPIDMDTVMHGLKREFQKMERMVTKGQFGPYYEVVAGGS